MREAGNQPEGEENSGGEAHGLRLKVKLPPQLFAHAEFRGRPAHDDAGRRGDDQGGNLGDQRVADRQDGVGLGRGEEREVLLEDADGKASADVDKDDEDPGDRLPAHEFAGPVHGPVEVCFPGDEGPPPPRLPFVDDPGVEVGVDAHLLARHGIQGEPGGHFRDAAASFGDDHKIDDHQDEEDDHADEVVPADDEQAEGFYDHARRRRPFVPVEEDETGRGDVQGQPEEGAEQKDGGKGRKLQGMADVQGGEEDEQGNGEAARKQDIQEQAGQGNDHDHQDGHDPDRHGDFAPLDPDLGCRN